MKFHLNTSSPHDTIISPRSIPKINKIISPGNYNLALQNHQRLTTSYQFRLLDGLTFGFGGTYSLIGLECPQSPPHMINDALSVNL